MSSPGGSGERTRNSTNDGEKEKHEDASAVITYTCHICSIEVPAAFSEEHNLSVKHRAHASIVAKASERMRALLTSQPAPRALATGKYCGACNSIVESGHGRTEKHKQAVREVKLLCMLASMYCGEEFEDDDDKTSHDDEVIDEKAVSVEKVNDDEDNKKGDVTANDATDFESVGKIEDKSAIADSINNVKETRSLSRKSWVDLHRKIASARNQDADAVKLEDAEDNVVKYSNELTDKNRSSDDNNKDLHSPHLGHFWTLVKRYKVEYQGSKFINICPAGSKIQILIDNIKLNVTYDNFNSFNNKEQGDRYCTVCMVNFDRDGEGDHLASHRHMSNVMLPVNDSDCYRRIAHWSYCILCKQMLMTNFEEKHKTLLTHINSKHEATVKNAANATVGTKVVQSDINTKTDQGSSDSSRPSGDGGSDPYDPHRGYFWALVKRFRIQHQGTGLINIRQADTKIQILIGNEKLTVSYDNFNSFKRERKVIRCQVCMVYFDNCSEDEHTASENHLAKIMLPVNDSHCYRRIMHWSHCILCKEVLMTNFEEKHKTLLHHIKNKDEARVKNPENTTVGTKVVQSDINTKTDQGPSDSIRPSGDGGSDPYDPHRGYFWALVKTFRIQQGPGFINIRPADTEIQISIGNEKLNVAYDHFNGFLRRSERVICIVCGGVNFDRFAEDEHTASENHMAKIMVPVNNSNCFRRMGQWNYSYCILCKQFIQYEEQHKTLSSHIDAQRKSKVKNFENATVSTKVVQSDINTKTDRGPSAASRPSGDGGSDPYDPHRGYFWALVKRFRIQHQGTGLINIRPADTKIQISIGNEKLNVDYDYFNSFFRMGERVKCIVCAGVSFDRFTEDEHTASENHMAKIMVPLNDSNCLRRVAQHTLYCMLCKELTNPDYEEHHKTFSFHIAAKRKATVPGKKEHEPQASQGSRNIQKTGKDGRKSRKTEKAAEEATKILLELIERHSASTSGVGGQDVAKTKQRKKITLQKQ